MLAFIQRLFNCDEKASLFEFYIYTIFALFFGLIAYLNYKYLDIDNNVFWYILGGVILICAVCRRAKDRGMTNDTIINYWAIVSVLILTSYLLGILCIIKFGFLMFHEINYFDAFWVGVLIIAACVYAIVFLSQILFLKGKSEGEQKINTIQYKQPTFPKIGDILNRDFFVNIFNFKGKTCRESGWIYFGIWFIVSFIVFIKNDLLDNIIYFFEYPFEVITNACDDVVLSSPNLRNFTWEWWVLGIVTLLILSLCVRRLRDLNIKPWKVIFLLLPPVNVFMLILMIFGKSEK